MPSLLAEGALLCNIICLQKQAFPIAPVFGSFLGVIIMASGDGVVYPGRNIQFPQLQLSRQYTTTNKPVKNFLSDLSCSSGDQEYNHGSKENYHSPEVMLLRR